MQFGIEIPAGKPFDAVAFGLNAVDHLIVVPEYPDFNTKVRYLSHTVAGGGQCATAVVALSRLGLITRYIGRVGDDEDGRFQLESLRSESVETSDVEVIPSASTQNAFILIDRASGERTIIWDRDDRLVFHPDDVDRAAVTSGRILLLDGHDVEASIRAAEYARAAGVPTVLDIDNAYPGTDRLLPLIDFMISSENFPARMTGEGDLKTALRMLSERNGSLLTGATLGDRGVLVLIRGGFIQVPAFSVECKDTTGAGDAFHGGFIHGLLRGLSVEDTLLFANAVAALKCRGIGGRTTLPRLEEVDAFLRSGARLRGGDADERGFSGPPRI